MILKNNSLVENTNKRRNNGDGALRKLKNGNWEGAEKIYRKNGTYIRKSVTRSDKKEVILLKNRLKALEPLDNDVIDIIVNRHTNVINLKMGEITPQGKKKEYLDKEITVNEYVDYWLWEHRRNGMKKRKIVDNTFADYVQKTRHIKNKLGTRIDKNNNRIPVKMNELTFEVIENALNELLRETCLQTTKQVRNHIINMLKCATKIDKVLKVNPLEDREINLIEVKKKKEKKIVAESDEIKVIEECIKLGYYHLLVALFTGARASEIAGMTWENFDFEENTVAIKQEYMQVKQYDYVDGKIVYKGRKMEVTDLKSKSSDRYLGLPKEIVEILKEYKERQKEVAKRNGFKFKESDFAFTSCNYRPYDNNDIYERMKNLMKVTKIKNWNELSPHSLRHTYCSTGVRNKVPIVDMKMLLGHENISVTAEWYTHFDKEQIINSSNEVNKKRMASFKSLNKKDGNLTGFF